MTIGGTGACAALEMGGLHAALAEAAGARADRNFRMLAHGLEALASCPDVDSLDALAVRARAMIAAEECAAARPGSAAGAASRLQTFLGRQQIAWPVVAEMMTSLTDEPLGPAAMDGLLALVAELMAWIAADAPQDRSLRLFLASEPDDGDVVFAFAAQGMDDQPVPSAAASRALRRAECLARLVGGGMVRGYRDGCMLVGLTVPIADRSES